MGDGDEDALYSTAPAEGYFVCDKCIDDEIINDFIRSNVEEHSCDFCGEENSDEPIAAPLDEVIEFMYQSIDREYQRAVEILGWDSREGGYQGSHWDSYELLTDYIGLSFPNDDDGSLLELMASCLGDEPWCERNPYSLSRDEKLTYSWERFCKLIKHERRYFFFLLEKGKGDEFSEHLDPSDLLKLIGDTVTEHGLIQTLLQGTLVYRARQQGPGQVLRSTYDLGPPPVEFAVRSNRMSPAGIVMFYGSSEVETAQAEIDDDPTLGIVVGTFRLAKDVRVLDLTNLPERVPFFHPDCTFDRYALNFLHDFVRDLAAKVEPGDREHVDYVPTQVVTEWFRSAFTVAASRIDGIYYPSSPRPGGRSLVLFADRGDLKLTTSEIEELTKSDPDGKWMVEWRQKSAWLQLVEVKQQRPANP